MAASTVAASVAPDSPRKDRDVDSIKSIAVPVTRKQAVTKARRAGRPAPSADNAVGGTVGEVRRQPAAANSKPMHQFRVGQRLSLSRGGRDIARAAALCQVTAVLPHEVGPLLYRVRSEIEGFERVVDENDLSMPE